MIRLGDKIEYGVPESAEKVAMLPGKIMVRMAERNTERGGILLTEREGRADTGVTVGVGYGSEIKGLDLTEEDLDVNEQVIVHPADGKRIEGFEWPCGRVEESEIRIYGATSPLVGAADPFPWDESLMMAKKPGEDWRPIGRNVLLDIGKKREVTESGLYLPDSVTDRDDSGVVLGVGRQVRHVTVGQRVKFNRRALQAIDAIAPDTAIISEVGILYALED